LEKIPKETIFNFERGVFFQPPPKEIERLFFE